MDRATASQLEEWDARPVSGGYAGLHDLADAGFTGAVVTGGTHLFMLNGRVVGTVDGGISDFEGTEATAYEAPDPALPLLFAMQARGGDVRGRYYTDDTPLREVDETLSSGGFTGYLELSENVLSGDYYVVYYGGRSLSASFVGSGGRVVTGDEAFDLAAGEVGIYEVRGVDLEVTDVPEPEGDASMTAVAAASSDEAFEAVSDDPEPADDGPMESDEVGEDVESEMDEQEADEVPDAGPTDQGTDEPEGAVVDGNEGPEHAVDADEGSRGDEEPARVEGPERDERPEREDESAETSESERAGYDEESIVEDAEPGPADDGPDTDAEDLADTSGERPSPAASGAAGRPPRRQQVPDWGEPEERFEEEARWREARTVPALDPEESERPIERQEPEPSPDETTPEATPPADSRRSPASGNQGAAEAEVDAYREEIRHFEAEIEASERERRRLADRLDEVVVERDDLVAEREAMAERIEELEDRIEQAETAAAAAATEASGEREPSPAGGAPDEMALAHETALDQTDLFVRYGSKAKATLQSAHDGRSGPEEVAENLRVESHSRFDPDVATVDGRPFGEYLRGTIEYRFVAWLVEELLYEIQDTGTEIGLRGLYDALPSVDRAEFYGTVTSRDEEGSEHSETFDVVCRNRMGKPLVVANINDSLDPATGSMMSRLVEDATTVGEAHESIGAAFLVTASFFEPDALETAADVTRGGGFLSRDSKKSFVKLSRNGGYHLCLVEARGDDFHVAVPEF